MEVFNQTALLGPGASDFHSRLHAHSTGDWLQIFGRSLGIVGVAELFDKTWFMGLLLAIRYSAKVVFVGSFAALFVHTILAAGLGYAFASFLSLKVLNYVTAVIFFGFALLYTKDWYQADPEADAIEAGKEEAGGDMDLDLLSKDGAAGPEPAGASSDSDEECKGTQRTHVYSSSSSDDSTALKASEDFTIFLKSFMGVFIAEWGDRTQIAMIGQHASQPLLPVFAGSVAAFFLLTLSAVGAASLLNGQKLREKVVFGCSAVCFAVFGAFALRDAMLTT